MLTVNFVHRSPKPKGVIAPQFLNLQLREDDSSFDDSDDEEHVTATGRRSRKASRKPVDYDESKLDSPSGGSGTKRKQGRSPGKTNKRQNTLSKSVTASNSDSDFTVELSDDEMDDSDDDSFASSKGSDNIKKASSTRKTNRKGIPWDEIPLDEVELATMSRVDRADLRRMIDYRKSAERVKKWLDTVDDLALPANPLDRLLNELGGPDKVAELTGRKVRENKCFSARALRFQLVTNQINPIRPGKSKYSTRSRTRTFMCTRSAGARMPLVSVLDYARLSCTLL